MDSKRAVGGIVGACGGFAMWIIQTTHPEWLGNHPWILPASLVLFFCALVLWLCQYAWMQRVLGITKPLSHDGAGALANPDIEAIKAHFAEQLKDLRAQVPSISIGGIPVAGPLAHDAEKVRQEAASQPLASVFTLLQSDAILLRRDLQKFLGEIGPEPACDTSDCLNDPRLNAKRLTEYHEKVIPFRSKVRSLYILRFKDRATSLYHRFVVAGMKDIHFGSLAETGESVQGIQELIDLLWVFAGKVKEEPNEKS